MKEIEVVEKIRESLKQKVIEITNPAPRRIFLKVDKNDLVEAVRFLKERFNFYHISTISGVDLGENFEILYHLANENCVLTVRTLTPRNEPKVPTITGVIPGATLYEREVHDMFGIVFEGHPNLVRLLLADDWPEGVYPLRKDWQFERPEEKIPGGK
uniref:NADH-quinone oxidoreductase subunit C n=1 Tax=candidate division WOR-3 bacterium TaxID=2052148 RepID=A0A7V0Z5K0_UNCW3